jgi:hypothetical protein
MAYAFTPQAFIRYLQAHRLPALNLEEITVDADYLIVDQPVALLRVSFADGDFFTLHGRVMTHGEFHRCWSILCGYREAIGPMHVGENSNIYFDAFKDMPLKITDRGEVRGYTHGICRSKFDSMAFYAAALDQLIQKGGWKHSLIASFPDSARCTETIASTTILVIVSRVGYKLTLSDNRTHVFDRADTLINYVDRTVRGVSGTVPAAEQASDTPMEMPTDASKGMPTDTPKDAPPAVVKAVDVVLRVADMHTGLPARREFFVNVAYFVLLEATHTIESFPEDTIVKEIASRLGPIGEHDDFLARVAARVVRG